MSKPDLSRIEPTALFPDRELALRSRGVPAHIARQPFEGDLPHVPGYDQATWSGDSEAWAVTLYGVPDAGKSMLAAQLMWLRLPSVRTAAWWRTTRLLDATFGHLGNETRTRACRECHADLLVIDDLGPHMGRRGLDNLCSIIDARRDEELATIFTLDIPLVTLFERYPALRWRLTSDTIAVPFDQTYEETAPRRSDRALS